MSLWRVDASPDWQAVLADAHDVPHCECPLSCRSRDPGSQMFGKPIGDVSCHFLHACMAGFGQLCKEPLVDGLESLQSMARSRRLLSC